jgi:MSHA biogenesis protein MshJ
MKRAWTRFEQWADSLTLNQRIVFLASVVAGLAVVAWVAAINPLLNKQKQLASSIKQQQALAAAMQTQIQKLATAQTVDPDAEAKARLERLRQQIAQMRTTMLDTQKDLVPPEKMAAVLEEILNRNSALHLKSLRTLPVTSLLEPLSADRRSRGAPGKAPPAAAGSAKAGAKGADTAPPSVTAGTPNLPAESIFKHGVEMVVEGQYLEILKYLAELESLPSQLFWGKAELKVEEYPNATLTLTLFTLSLDKRWMGI